jgi:pimeloyl-[acyl-carrier protein] methyl ester esterase
MKLLFLHGWGFDASLWDRIRAALAPMEAVVWDRGYFGAGAQEKVDGALVAIGHSFGSLLLASDPPPNCIALIAINGFDRFAGERVVESRLLDRMHSRFSTSPAAVLDDFRQRVGAARNQRQMHVGRLAADLDLLKTLDARGRLLPRLVLHGGKDPILPPSMREGLFAGARQVTLASGGHLLPLSHPSWCADRIREVLG